MIWWFLVGLLAGLILIVAGCFSAGYAAGMDKAGRLADPSRLKPVPPDVRVLSLNPPQGPGWHALTPTPPGLPRAGRLTWQGSQDEHYELARLASERNPFPTQPQPIVTEADFDAWVATWTARNQRMIDGWQR